MKRWRVAVSLGVVALLVVSLGGPVLANAGPPPGRPTANFSNPVDHDERKSDHKAAVAKEREAEAAKEHDGPADPDIF